MNNKAWETNLTINSTEFAVVVVIIGAALLARLLLPAGRPISVGEALNWLLTRVFWVALAVAGIALVGVAAYLTFGWLGTIPSWAAVIIVLLVLIWLTNITRHS
jgi:hypothetical protein